MRSFRLLGFIFVHAGAFTLAAFGSDKQVGNATVFQFAFHRGEGRQQQASPQCQRRSAPRGKNGKQSKGGFQLKTDNEGKTESEGLPYGPLRIQVLAPGFQTFGDDYDINKPDMDIEIRLKRPSDQLSIYDKPKDKQQEPPATPPTEPKPQ